MKTRQVISIVAILMALCLAPIVHAGDGPPVSGKAMVGLQGTTIEAFLDIVNQEYPSLDAMAIDSVPAHQMYLIQFNKGAGDVGAFADDLDTTWTKAGYLRWGELLYLGQAPEGVTGSTWVGGSVTSFSTQYSVDLLDVPAAQKSSTGAGVVVAVLDTGIDASHPALEGHIAAGGYNFITNSPNTADIGDGGDNDADGFTDEMTGHGTYVAGLITLIAPDAKLLPVTVLDTDGVGDLWTLAKGIHYAIDHGVEVINLSLSTTYNSAGVAEAVHDAKQMGIVVVAAAGNLNQEDPRQFPAMLSWEHLPDGEEEPVALGIAATNPNDIKGGFSNFEKRLFLSAPGANLPGADQSIVSTLPGDQYAQWEGTSMCAPMVSATAALIRAQHPEWEANVTTWRAIKDALAGTAVDIYPMNPAYANPPKLGAGRLDAGAAVALGPAAPGIGDLNNDGVVNTADLLNVINHWGQVHASADLDGDGVVNAADLLIVLNAWG